MRKISAGGEEFRLPMITGMKDSDTYRALKLITGSAGWEVLKGMVVNLLVQANFELGAINPNMASTAYSSDKAQFNSGQAYGLSRVVQLLVGIENMKEEDRKDDGVN